MADTETISSIITRQEALAAGLKHYFTGSPCKNGHLATRFAKRAACTLCSRISQRDRYHSDINLARRKTKKRRDANRESVRLHNRLHYHKRKKENPELVRILARERMQAWRKKNPEKAREGRRRSRLRNIEAERARGREYYRATIQKQKLRHKEYRSRKPHVIAAISAKRRASIKSQTPLWADQGAIKEKYREAETLTRALGVKFSVDHAIPLRGKTVCGLHVENNLVVIPLVDNSRKSNKLTIIQ